MTGPLCADGFCLRAHGSWSSGHAGRSSARRPALASRIEGTEQQTSTSRLINATGYIAVDMAAGTTLQMFFTGRDDLALTSTRPDRSARRRLRSESASPVIRAGTTRPTAPAGSSATTPRPPQGRPDRLNGQVRITLRKGGRATGGTRRQPIRREAATRPATPNATERVPDTGGRVGRLRRGHVRRPRLARRRHAAGDAAPSVTSTTPANNASDVANDANISITFSEPVNVSGSWYTISCTDSGAHAATASRRPDGPTCSIRTTDFDATRPAPSP